MNVRALSVGTSGGRSVGGPSMHHHTDDTFGRLCFIEIHWGLNNERTYEDQQRWFHALNAHLQRSRRTQQLHLSPAPAGQYLTTTIIDNSRNNIDNNNDATAITSNYYLRQLLFYYYNK